MFFTYDRSRYGRYNLYKVSLFFMCEDTAPYEYTITYDNSYLLHINGASAFRFLTVRRDMDRMMLRIR